MANDKQRLYAFHLCDMLPDFYGLAMPIDSWDATHHCHTSGFIVLAQGISVPISWGSPPILERMNR